MPVWSLAFEGAPYHIPDSRLRKSCVCRLRINALLANPLRHERVLDRSNTVAYACLVPDGKIHGFLAASRRVLEGNLHS